MPNNGQTDANQFYRLSFTYKLDRAARFQLTHVFEWSEESRVARNPVISPWSSRTTNDGRTDYTTAEVSPRSVNLGAGERKFGLVSPASMVVACLIDEIPSAPFSSARRSLARC